VGSVGFLVHVLASSLGGAPVPGVGEWGDCLSEEAAGRNRPLSGKPSAVSPSHR